MDSIVAELDFPFGFVEWKTSRISIEKSNETEFQCDKNK